MWQAPQETPTRYGRTSWFVAVIVRVVHETLAVPFLARFVVELRIREKPEAEHAGGFAVNLFVDPGRLRFDLLVEPEAVFIRLGSRRGSRVR